MLLFRGACQCDSDVLGVRDVMVRRSDNWWTSFLCCVKMHVSFVRGRSG